MDHDGCRCELVRSLQGLAKPLAAGGKEEACADLLAKPCQRAELGWMTSCKTIDSRRFTAVSASHPATQVVVAGHRGGCYVPSSFL